jgi:transcriptional regulator with XRE-family HTH domain
LSSRGVAGFNPSALLCLRTAAGLTQSELADRARLLGARVLPINICQYEQGRRSPQFSTLQALATSLGVEPTELLKVPEQADLTTLRTLAGLTQRLLSVQLGVAQARWSRIECGRSSLDVSKHPLAADLLQVSIEQLRRALALARTRKRTRA